MYKVPIFANKDRRNFNFVLKMQWLLYARMTLIQD